MYRFTGFTQKANDALNSAISAAENLGHTYVGSEHILLGLLAEKGGMAYTALSARKISYGEVESIIRSSIGIGSPTVLSPNDFTPRAKNIIDTAIVQGKGMGHSYIGTEHILLGIIREEEGVAGQILANLGLNLPLVRETVLNFVGDDQANDDEPAKEAAMQDENPEPVVRFVQPSTPKGSSKTPTLDEYTRDLTALAAKGQLDPVIGRENEIERIVQILARRNKNNPVLIGEPGVGKTAIVEGLAQKIARGEISDVLAEKRLLALDLASVVAGTKYRGEFEQRLKNIIDELAAAKNAIVFIDELHTIIGAGAAEGSIDASNMLKPALARGEVQCIGATTFDEYRKYIEADTALERRFQPVVADPPDVDETITILHGLRPKYEAHHGVTYTDGAVRAAATIAERYITDRALPDKALDLFDEAGARARLKNAILPPEIKQKQAELTQAVAEKEQLLSKKEFEKAAQAKETEARLREYIEHLKKEWQEKNHKRTPKVTEEDIALVASKWTGIPVTRLTQSETDKILHMEEHLHERIIGQEDAVKAVSQAIRRNRTGLGNPHRPIGGFLFLGPTGVGKTELAKSLAAFLFGDEEAMIRLDMSEYMEKFAVSRLIGAPPGYVGYEEGGQLTEAVRRRPYSVVVLDELEKAHPDIYNILLQVLDEGALSDNLGHKVSFKNCVIIMTSNVGAREITNKGNSLGFTAQQSEEEQYKDMRQHVMDEVKKTFNPEFINRIDEIVVFHALSKENITAILEVALGHVNDKLKERQLTIKLSPAAKAYLVEKGFDAKFGARPLLRTIQRELEDPLAEHILVSRAKAGSLIKVDFDKTAGKLMFSSAAAGKKKTISI